MKLNKETKDSILPSLDYWAFWRKQNLPSPQTPNRHQKRCFLFFRVFYQRKISAEVKQVDLEKLLMKNTQVNKPIWKCYSWLPIWKLRKVNFSDDFKRTVNHPSYMKTQTISMHYVPIYQCSFHKSYNAQNCILMMNEKN